MSKTGFTPGSGDTRVKFWAVVAAVGLIATFALTGHRSAAVALGVSSFEIDGDATASGGTDWNTPPPNLVLTNDANYDGSGNFVGGACFKNQSPDDIHQNNDKIDDVPPAAALIIAGSLPAKDDLCQVFTAHETIGAETYLYLGWTRLKGNGSSTVYFELNQAAGTSGAITARTVGDRLIGFYFQGTSFQFLTTSTWQANNTWTNPVAIPAASAEGAVSADGLFGEAALKLSAILPAATAPASCVTFQSGTALTQTGNVLSSFHSSTLQDHVGAWPLGLSNCGSITIVKTTLGGNGTFSYTVTCPGVSASPSITTVGGTGTVVIPNIPLGSQCTVTEATVAGFVQIAPPLPGGRTVTTGQTATFTNAKPSISVAKSASPTSLQVGQTVTYTFDVTNTGAVALTLTAAGVVDPKCDAAPTGPAFINGNADASFDPAEVWRFTCTRVIQANDPDPLPNTVTVTAKDPLNRDVTATANALVDIVKPGIHITKSANPTTGHVGDTIVYTYTVTNTGQVNITNVAVTDDKCSPVVLNAGASVGAADNILNGSPDSWVYNCSRVLLAGDPDVLINTATVTGKDPTGATVTDKATATVTIVRPAINLTKTANVATVLVGATITYTMHVQATGNVSLINVSVSDPVCDPGTLTGPTFLVGNNDAILELGELWSYTCTHIATAGDAPSLTNTATASGTDPLGLVVTDTGSATVSVIVPPPTGGGTTTTTSTTTTTVPGATTTTLAPTTTTTTVNPPSVLATTTTVAAAAPPLVVVTTTTPQNSSALIVATLPTVPPLPTVPVVTTLPPAPPAPTTAATPSISTTTTSAPAPLTAAVAGVELTKVPDAQLPYTGARHAALLVSIALVFIGAGGILLGFRKRLRIS